MNIQAYFIQRFQHKSCHILGFGRSNRPLCTLLLNAGAEITVHDQNERIREEAFARELAARGAVFATGEDYLSGLDGDFIFRSPGFRHDLPELRAATDKGACLTSEMELFFEVCPCPIIGITGSDGKTTTTTVTHLLLETEFAKEGKRRAYVGGNIGAPLLPLVFEMTAEDIAVVELSSFQLQTMQRSPSRSLITNITPNHLNWHSDMEEYITAKCNICRHAPVEMLVANAENDITREIAKNSDLPITYFSSKKTAFAEIVPFFKAHCKAVYEDGGVICFDDGEWREEVIKTADILLPGRHNVENYMSAIALTRGLVSNETIRAVASTFGGVEHRLELVRTHKGVKYYNSSIDSSPTRTAAALGALSKAPVIICGGSEKGVAFDGLAHDLCTRVKATVLVGESADHILEAVLACPDYDPEQVTVKRAFTFREAVLAASSMAEEGDIVLLSPACASFDMFRDFAERGNVFRDIVNELE